MIVETRAEAAATMGITERSLDRWRTEQSFPDTTKGYDCDAILAWRRKTKLRKRPSVRGQLDRIESQLNQILEMFRKN